MSRKSDPVPLIRESPRLLTRNPGMAKRDYTAPDKPFKGGLIDEPEPVPRAYEAGTAAQAREADRLRQLRDMSEQGRRIDELTAMAQARGVDISNQAKAVERQIRTMETKVRRAA